jgi:hypothetical protein
VSTFLNTARARTLRPGGALPRPRLTIVPKVAARAPRIPFALLVVTVLAAGLIGLLLLNTALQRGAYTVTDLQDRSDNLTLQQQNLELEVATLESPQRISERAVRIGMVSGDSPAFLSLKTGKVIGVPKAGVRSHQPAIALTGTGGTETTGTTANTPTRTPPSTAAPLVPNANAKLAPLVSGESASLTAGAFKVPRTDRHDGKPGKPGDTRRNSRDQGGPGDTKNSNNNSHTR